MTKLEYYLRKISCFFRIRFQGNKKERLRVYKGALELLNNNYKENGTMRGFCWLCNALDYSFKEVAYMTNEEFYKKLPELYIHRPFKHGAFWLTSDNKRGYEIRKSILEKAIKQLS